MLNARKLEVFAIALNIQDVETPKPTEGSASKGKRDESLQKKGTICHAVKKFTHRISTISFKKGGATGEV